MGDKSELRYAVLLIKQEFLRPPEIAHVLAAVRKVPFHDVIPAAKSSWGIIAGDLEKKAAQELAGLLSGSDLGALAIPRTLIEDLPPARKAAELGLGPDGLHVPRDTGGTERVAKERLALIAASGFKEAELKKEKGERYPSAGHAEVGFGLAAVTGLPIGPGRRKREPAKPPASSELVFYFDLFLKNPSERLRIDAQRFDFSCLKARMAYNVLGNLRRLIESMVRIAPAARQNRGAKVIAEKRPLREMGYETPADLDRECRWLLTLDSLGLPADS
ncbi:MAG: hypothetical protein ABII00_16540 [Elusimicrobiota bacterium]